ncbi:MAG TPA: GDCCVxC domain-containing (seleno)protein [Xanthobacteraceae bacterium]|nr:GDCCVxC domain-containing (seleno)protein [Xanthobacteraceae bacterium]
MRRRTRAVLTCPFCSHAAKEIMPRNACVYIYRCKSCGAELRPKRGDCCVFCSYGSVVCPPKRREKDTLLAPLPRRPNA